MAMTRRRLIVLAAAGAVALRLDLSAGPALAAGPEPFSDDAFSAAQAAGGPILVAVSAPWCPICRSQKVALATLVAEPRFRELRIFEIDFDTQKALMRRFGARQQSTLVAFRGTAEVGRSVGETQAEWIETLLDKAASPAG